MSLTYIELKNKALNDPTTLKKGPGHVWSMTCDHPHKSLFLSEIPQLLTHKKRHQEYVTNARN